MQASGAIETGGRLSQKFGADLSRADQNKFSGDADLPSKLPLADRRAKLDNVSSLAFGVQHQHCCSGTHFCSVQRRGIHSFQT